MISVESFSERRFPGYASWIGGFYLISLASGFFSVLATSRAQDGRLMDLTQILLLQPLAQLVAVAILVAVFVFFLRAPVKAILQAITPWLPLFIAASVIDLALSCIGIYFAGTFVNASGALSALLTAGLLPIPLASIGTAALIVFAVVMMYRTVLRARRKKTVAIQSAVALYLLSIVALLVPSILGWFALTAPLTAFTAGALSVRRGIIVLVNGGYWWDNLYDRFPFALGGEAEIAGRLLIGALIFIILAVVTSVLVFRSAKLDRLAVWRHLRGDIAWLPFVLVAFGWAIAIGQGATFPFKFSQLVALVLFLLVIFFAWTYVVGLNHKHDLAMDAAQGINHPLATGDLSMAHADDLNGVFLLFAVAGSFLLGWPVLYAMMAFVGLRSLFDLPPFRLKRLFPINALLLGASNLALVLAGWFFGVEHANLAKFPSGLAVGLLLTCAALSVFKDVKDREGDRLHGIRTLPNGVQAKNIIHMVALTLAVGYVILPAVAGWWRWEFVAIPIAGASAFFAYSKPFSERALRRLFLVFFAVSALLAASGWLIPS